MPHWLIGFGVGFRRPRLKSILYSGCISQGFPSPRLEVITHLLIAWWSRRRTSRGFPLGMTVPPVNLPRPSRIIVVRSGTAYSTRQAWLISQLTSISEGLSSIRHPVTRLVGDSHSTTELGGCLPQAAMNSALQHLNACLDVFYRRCLLVFHAIFKAIVCSIL